MPRPAVASGVEKTLNELLDDYERSLIVMALRATGGEQRRAAGILGILATTLQGKMRRLRIAVVKPGDEAGEDAVLSLSPPQEARPELSLVWYERPARPTCPGLERLLAACQNGAEPRSTARDY